MKATVSITYRPGVLDPEAAAVGRSLAGLGFAGVRSVKRVRQIEIDLDMDDRQDAEAAVKAMCDKLLANPVIETYRIDLPA